MYSNYFWYNCSYLAGLYWANSVTSHDLSFPGLTAVFLTRYRNVFSPATRKVLMRLLLEYFETFSC